MSDMANHSSVKPTDPNMPAQYYLWGAGGVGRRAAEHLSPLGIIKGIIDSDPIKQDQSLSGLAVTGYEKGLVGDCGVIISVFDSEEIEEQMKRDGVPYWKLSDFITDWFCETQSKAAIAFMDIPITSRCTLNCKHCMQYIPYREKKIDVSIGDIQKRLENLYNSIDYVLEASLIGGEPFLHPDLACILYSIDRKKIKSLVITTNGMATPDEEVLKACAKTDVFISISDYSHTLPHIISKVDEFARIVKESGINCERKNQVWIAPGKFGGGDSKEAGRCSRTHFQLSDDGLWYCSLQCGAYLSNICGGVENRDFIRLDAGCRPNRRDVYDFLAGHTTSLCSRCENRNGQIVPVAEQM